MTDLKYRSKNNAQRRAVKPRSVGNVLTVQNIDPESGYSMSGNNWDEEELQKSVRKWDATLQLDGNTITAALTVNNAPL